MTRIIVSGSRTGYDNARVHQVMNHLYATYDPLTVLEGCAPGVDRQVEEWALSMDAVEVQGRLGERGTGRLVLEHWPALWLRHERCWCGPGKERCGFAGHRRNLEMLHSEPTLPDLVTTFHDYILNSRGTKHMAEAATQAGVEVLYIGSEL